MDDSMYQTSQFFDDHNSKDFGRRSMAAQQSSIVGVEHWGKEGSFKLKRVDYKNYYSK
jgi:hypothetical protein